MRTKILLTLLLCQAAIEAPALAGSVLVAASPASSAIKQSPPPPIFNGRTGQVMSWDEMFAAMAAADVVVVGESHTDARTHELQRDIIENAIRLWPDLILSLEEFDRGEQAALTAFELREISGTELQAGHIVVDRKVKQNWSVWILPILETGRDGGATLLASNAPLKYSRLVRNAGCDDLPELQAAERNLFDCPIAAEDPEYKARFARMMTSVAANNKSSGLKPMQSEQIDRMFRAHRLWDATMAQSIVQARLDHKSKVLHLVGNFHVDFNGGLVQELREGDEDSRILVISMRPVRGPELKQSDRDRADILIYTRG